MLTLHPRLSQITNACERRSFSRRRAILVAFRAAPDRFDFVLTIPDRGPAAPSRQKAEASEGEEAEARECHCRRFEFGITSGNGGGKSQCDCDCLARIPAGRARVHVPYPAPSSTGGCRLPCSPNRNLSSARTHCSHAVAPNARHTDVCAVRTPALPAASQTK